VERGPVQLGGYRVVRTQEGYSAGRQRRNDHPRIGGSPCAVKVNCLEISKMRVGEWAKVRTLKLKIHCRSFGMCMGMSC